MFKMSLLKLYHVFKQIENKTLATQKILSKSYIRLLTMDKILLYNPPKLNRAHCSDCLKIRKETIKFEAMCLILTTSLILEQTWT